VQQGKPLNKENIDRGFTATEFGGQIIKIYFKGGHIANFNQTTTPAEVMDDFCATYWDGMQRATVAAAGIH